MFISKRFWVVSSEFMATLVFLVGSSFANVTFGEMEKLEKACSSCLLELLNIPYTLDWEG